MPTTYSKTMGGRAANGLRIAQTTPKPSRKKEEKKGRPSQP